MNMTFGRVMIFLGLLIGFVILGRILFPGQGQAHPAMVIPFIATMGYFIMRWAKEDESIALPEQSDEEIVEDSTSEDES